MVRVRVSVSSCLPSLTSCSDISRRHCGGMLYLVRDRVRVSVRIRVRVRVRVRVRRHCGGMLLLVQVGRSHA